MREHGNFLNYREREDRIEKMFSCAERERKGLEAERNKCKHEILVKVENKRFDFRVIPKYICLFCGRAFITESEELKKLSEKKMIMNGRIVVDATKIGQASMKMKEKIEKLEEIYKKVEQRNGDNEERLLLDFLSQIDYN